MSYYFPLVHDTFVENFLKTTKYKDGKTPDNLICDHMETLWSMTKDCDQQYEDGKIPYQQDVFDNWNHDNFEGIEQCQ